MGGAAPGGQQGAECERGERGAVPLIRQYLRQVERRMQVSFTT